MPVRHMANNRIKITTNDSGDIIKVTGKNRAGHAYKTFSAMRDNYGDYGVSHMGEDAIGRTNHWGATVDGGYVCDVETLEAYGNAIVEMAASIRRQNERHHETRTGPIEVRA